MSNSKIMLVQGDTAPSLVLTLADQNTGLPINVTGSTVLLKFRALGSNILTDTITADVTDGAAGKITFNWSNTSLSGPPGPYEGEVEITFADGKVQTLPKPLRFSMRAQF